MLIRFLISLLLFILIIPGYAAQMDEGREAIDYLKALDFEELLDVEVVLDDVFDVFDGLIKARKTTIATGETQSTARAPSVTSVITAQDIEAMGARNMDEALEAIPGLHVTKRSQVYGSSYIIRGMYSDYNPEALVLVNGIPWRDLALGGRGQTWMGLPASVISRIEVIRGPGSAVYGADAFAGVINVITKSKDDIDGTEAGIRLGSFNTQDAWILHGNQWGDFDIAVMLDYHNTDGHEEIIEADAQTEIDHAFRTSASHAPGPPEISKRNFEVYLNVARKNWRGRVGYQGWHDWGNGAGLAQALDPEYVGNRTERFLTDLTYHNPTFTPYWDVTAQISLVDFQIGIPGNIRLFPRGAFGGAYPNGMIGNPGYGQRHTRFNLFGFYAGFRKHLIRIGTGYHYGDLYQVTESKNYKIDRNTGIPIPLGSIVDVTDTSSIWLPEGSRKDWYISLQDIWYLAPDWEFTMGIRYDHYSDFGSTVNPRLALVWQPRRDFTTKLLYGSAFRAPSFIEQYTINNPVLLGNPDIVPETVQTWELAFDYQATDNLHLTMNLVNYQAEDKILYVSEPSVEGTVQNIAQNAGSQEAYGLEFETRWKMNTRSSLLANYAFMKVTDENNDFDGGNYPRHSAYLRTDWLLYPNWYLDAQVTWIGEMKRVYLDQRPPLDDHTTVDLTLRRKDIKEGHWNFAVSVRNLFDTDVREPALGPNSKVPNDLPQAGRNYFLELRYRF